MFYDCSNLKEGDKVIVVRGHLGGRAVKTVHRVTNTMIVVQEKNLANEPYEVRFRKSDGDMIGGGTWNTTHLEEWTQEKEDAIRLAYRKNKLVEKLSKVAFDKLSVNALEQIEKIIDDSTCKV